MPFAPWLNIPSLEIKTPDFYDLSDLDLSPRNMTQLTELLPGKDWTPPFQPNERHWPDPAITVIAAGWLDKLATMVFSQITPSFSPNSWRNRSSTGWRRSVLSRRDD